MIGKLISIANGPKRNAEIRIDGKSLFSAMAIPPGEIEPTSVVGLIVERKRRFFRDCYHLRLKLKNMREINFYRSRQIFDIALILDELEAAIGDIPRTLINLKLSVDQVEQGSGGNGG